MRAYLRLVLGKRLGRHGIAAICTVAAAHGIPAGGAGNPWDRNSATRIAGGGAIHASHGIAAADGAAVKHWIATSYGVAAPRSAWPCCNS